jgi:alkyl hydroperoxide reductase subunit AhpC
VSAPVYHDVRGDATRIIGAWGTPSYFVLDVDGRIRFPAVHDLETVRRQVEVLRVIAPDREAEIR